MPELKSTGTFQVRVIDALIKPAPIQAGNKWHPAGDPKAFRLLLKCETPDGYHAWYDTEWSVAICASGKNQGLTRRQITTNLLVDLGVKDGYPPNLKAAIESGIAAEIVMEHREYTDPKTSQTKKILECKYLNPPRKTIRLEEADWDQLLSDTPAEAADDDKMPITDDEFNPGSEAEPSSDVPF